MNLVYLMRSGSFFKIGRSTTRNIWRRLDTLQAGNPVPIQLLLWFPGDPEDEQALHQKFFSHRVHGEWFHDHPAIFEAFEARKAHPASALSKPKSSEQHPEDRIKRAKQRAAQEAYLRSIGVD